MAVASTDALGTYTGLRDRCARKLGAPTYATLTSTAQQARVNDSIDDALDEIAGKLNIKTFEREAGLQLFGPATGTDGVVTIHDETVTSAAGFQDSSGVSDGNCAAHDKLIIGDLKTGGRIASITSQNSIEMALKYPGASATAQAWTRFRDEYALAASSTVSAWYLSTLWNETTGRPILLVDEAEFIEKTGNYPQAGEPAFAMICSPLGSEDANTVGARLRFHPYPSRRYTVLYKYQTVPVAGSTLVTSPHLNALLSQMAMRNLMLEVDEPEKSREHHRAVQNILKDMLGRDAERAPGRIVMADQWAVPGVGDPSLRLREPREVTDS